MPQATDHLSTPRPWRVRRAPPGHAPLPNMASETIEDATGVALACVWKKRGRAFVNAETAATGRANAALIISAVNNRERLVRALTAAEVYIGVIAGNDADCETLNLIRDALAQAGA